MPIQLNGATSGSTTLVATDAVTATLTLPSSTGTLVSTASPQSGSVLQVVNYNGNGYATTTSSTWTNVPDLSLSITPKFATSKILISLNVSGVGKTANTYVGLRLLKNGSSISTFNDVGSWTNSTSEITTSIGYQYLDSPATTSATTYSVQFNSGQNISIAIVGNYINTLASTRHSITLMEIAA